MHARRSRRHTQAGFSLIELMVTVSVMAILATISVTSYRKYSIRANRTEARIALLSIQTAQEKFFLQNNQYAQNLATVIAPPPGGLGVALDSTGLTPGGHYLVSFTVATPNTFTVQAVATGSQTKDDAACQTYSVNQMGVLSPPQGNTCWR